MLERRGPESSGAGEREEMKGEEDEGRKEGDFSGVDTRSDSVPFGVNGIRRGSERNLGHLMFNPPHTSSSLNPPASLLLSTNDNPSAASPHHQGVSEKSLCKYLIGCSTPVLIMRPPLSVASPSLVLSLSRRMPLFLLLVASKLQVFPPLNFNGQLLLCDVPWLHYFTEEKLKKHEPCRPRWG